MNDLKKYAGLLNDIAPEGEFLAYINKDESDLLKSKGAKGLLTPQGIPSYRGEGGYQGGSSSSSSSSSGGSSSSSGGSSSSSGDGGGGGGGGQDYSSVPASAPTVSAPTYSGGGSGDNNTVDPGFQNALMTPQVQGIVDAENEYLAPDIDHYKATQKAINTSIKDLGDLDQSDYSDWSKEDQDTYQLEMNKLKGTEGKNYSFYAGNEGTINNTFGENWKDAVVVTPALKFSPTLRFLVAGAKTLYQNATTDYGTGYYGGTDFTGGGSGMPVDGGGWIGRIFNSDGSVNTDISESEAQGIYNQAQSDLPYLINNTTPQDSMVNQYFANQPTSGSGLSSDLQTSYNNAKNSVNSILGMTPTNQQFGYSAQPYGLLSSTNMADNPYNIPYLQQRGLI
jgi:hypothetical protein